MKTLIEQQMTDYMSALAQLRQQRAVLLQQLQHVDALIGRNDGAVQACQAMLAALPEPEETAP